MMDHELLSAISDMMDEKLGESLKPINGRLDGMENRLNVIEHKADRTAEKLENLRLDVMVAQRDIRRDIYVLKDEVETAIEILKMNGMSPDKRVTV